MMENTVIRDSVKDEIKTGESVCEIVNVSTVVHVSIASQLR